MRRIQASLATAKSSGASPSQLQHLQSASLALSSNPGMVALARAQHLNSFPSRASNFFVTTRAPTLASELRQSDDSGVAGAIPAASQGLVRSASTSSPSSSSSSLFAPPPMDRNTLYVQSSDGLLGSFSLRLVEPNQERFATLPPGEPVRE